MICRLEQILALQLGQCKLPPLARARDMEARLAVGILHHQSGEAALRCQREESGGVYLRCVAKLASWQVGKLLRGTYLAPEGYAVLGYGVAYFLAHLPNNVFLHRGVARYIGQPRYGMNLLWAVALGVALFAPIAHYIPLLALGVFLLPASRRALRELLHEVRALRTQS